MNDLKTYPQALDFLFSYVDYSLTHQENIAAENFELARMFRFMDLLGDPHLDYPTLHIAGTKGKGSVSVLCAAALQAAGYKVGLYTSPHLEEFTERFQINRQPISQPDFVQVLNELTPFIAKVPNLTSYEIQTALAFWYFGQQKVDIAVIEVGMGGRLDSTNVVSPLVSIISSISLDHTAILGDSLAIIAAEKGGIIKDDVPVVVAPQLDEVKQVLKKIAAEKSAPITLVDETFEFEILSHSLEGQIIQLRENNEVSLEFQLSLLGAHQAENAAVAFAGLKALTSLKISEQAFQSGFAKVKWPGRFEVLQNQPAVVLDVAHNRYSAQKLRQAVAAYFPGAPVTLVFGALADKDIQGMFAELLPNTHTLIPVQPDHPRAAAAEDLHKLAASYTCQLEPLEAFEHAWERALSVSPPGGVILVTGSLTTVGQLRTGWFLR
jgi:dihydrofolate synthase/folylpolyglutamate synthase